MTLCIKEFIPRRFFTPSPPTATTSPATFDTVPPKFMSLNDDANNMVSNVDNDEIIYFEDEDDEVDNCQERVSNISILNESNKSEMEEASDEIDIENLPMSISSVDELKNNKEKPPICVVTIFSGGLVFG